LQRDQATGKYLEANTHITVVGTEGHPIQGTLEGNIPKCLNRWEFQACHQFTNQSNKSQISAFSFLELKKT
jgi:hypothetical protein